MITDWIQSMAAFAALLMSAGGLIWQARTAHSRRQERLTVEAGRWTPRVWRVDLSVDGYDRSNGLSAMVRLKGKTGVSLVAIADLPPEPSGSLLLLIPRPDYAKAEAMPITDRMRVELAHAPSPSTAASGEFALVVAREATAVRLRVSVMSPGRRLPLISRTILVSPTA